MMQNKQLNGVLPMKWYNTICNFLVNIKKDPSDYRRKETEKEAEKTLSVKDKKYIICGDQNIPIDWDDVILYDDPQGFSLPKNCYKTVKNKRNPSMFVAHWDVCLSSKSCYNVLKKRKLSVHFLIDNDGTIYQLMNCNDIAFHAGNRKVNNKSIGVEISNAYYLKYQNIYRSRGFGPRPTWSDAQVHGKTLEPFLGFYPWQEEAFQALTKALNKVYEIPIKTPVQNGNFITTVVPEVRDATFEGVVNHYHITNRKIDCAGFELDEVLKEIT